MRFESDRASEMATTAAVGDDGTVVAAAGRSKKNRIQVSTNKKPLFFYVNLAKVSLVSFSLFLSQIRI